MKQILLEIFLVVGFGIYAWTFYDADRWALAFVFLAIAFLMRERK